MAYIENPKTRGSGILACIPQTGVCPNQCSDCFFQSGRSYLEPLSENLPNIPTAEMAKDHVVRINDGNDSNVDRATVLEVGSQFDMKFYNTAIPKNLDKFDAPVVLTLNPGEMTDIDMHIVEDKESLENLMFVRFRTNTWNLDKLDEAVEYYTSKEVPVMLTFMAYHDEASIPLEHRANYMSRKRTSNDYFAITTAAWEQVMAKYKYNLFVYSCGKIEGEKGKTSCRFCGNCLREYFASTERQRVAKAKAQANLGQLNIQSELQR